MSPFQVAQPWEAPDPLPVMRREMKLLIVELNVLRGELDQLREMREQSRIKEAVLSASFAQLTDNLVEVTKERDHWRAEAERLHTTIDEAPSWSLLRQRIVGSFRAWIKPTDQSLHCA
jgi:hypothetical protein